MLGEGDQRFSPRFPPSLSSLEGGMEGQRKGRESLRPQQEICVADGQDGDKSAWVPEGEFGLWN